MAGPDYVAPRTRLDGPVLLVESDPAWPATYAAEQSTITGALAEGALLVEHAGSTAVPGLVAKPVVDVVLVVADPTDERAYIPALTSAGYRLHLREPGWYQHRLLRKDSPAVNLHVFGPGTDEVDRMLAFRDRLRTDPEARRRYEATKRELAARHWEHVQDYADAKSAVIAQILATP